MEIYVRDSSGSSKGSIGPSKMVLSPRSSPLGLLVAPLWNHWRAAAATVACVPYVSSLERVWFDNRRQTVAFLWERKGLSGKEVFLSDDACILKKLLFFLLVP